MRWTALIAVLVMVCVVMCLSGCENTEPSEKERGEIESAVRAYLEALAEAYSSMDVSGLEDRATGKEIADIRRLLKDLEASGDRVESTLLGFEITTLSVFRKINATVSLVEIWDVRRYDAFTGREKGRNPKSVQNTIFQMRLMDGKWMVTGRQVLQDSKSSRWKVTTPTPVAAKESE